MRSPFDRLPARQSGGDSFGASSRTRWRRARSLAIDVLALAFALAATSASFAQQPNAFPSVPESVIENGPTAFDLPQPVIQPVAFSQVEPPAQPPNQAPTAPGLPSRVPTPTPTTPYEEPHTGGAGGAFGPGQIRLPLLGGAGITPHPTPATLDRFKQFVTGTLDPENTLDLVQGRPRILVLKHEPIRFQIADDRIATVLPIDSLEFSITGVRVGSTILNLWFAEPDGRTSVLSYLLRVIPDPDQKERLERIYKALESEINHAFPNSAVHLTLLGDKLVVSGEAKDIVEASQILRVASANAPGGARGQQADLNEIPIGNLNVTAIPDASGNLPTQGLENYLLRDVNRNVINLLRVSGEQQVQLRVTVAEINRTAARSIGLDLSVLNAAGTTVFENTTGGLLSVAVSGIGGSSGSLTGANLPALIDNGKVSLAIQALRNLNLARSLAEQNLVALNGQRAQFQAGGEFPVPAATLTFGAVGQGVSFIPFGVQMQFIPYITDRDRIRLTVSATVSTLNPSLGATVGAGSGSTGTSVPGLNSRSFQTTVELRSGQTFAVAGLTQSTYGASTVRVPFFGDLPILGPLAGENQASHGEQEVMILITPDLTHPLQECATPPVAGADVFEPGDVEFYLLNRLESRRSYDYRSSVRTDCPRQRRYEHCDDVFIIGAHGQANNCCPANGPCYPASAPVPDPGVPPMPADSGKGEAHVAPAALPAPQPALLPVPAQQKAEPPSP